MTKTETETAPEVWIGCLGCYNAGALVGAWMPAADGPEFNPHGPETLAAAGLERPACGPYLSDEFWVFDYQGFGPFLSGECSPAEAARVAELLEAIEADGHDVEAVGAWVGYTGERIESWEDARESFEDAYQGTYDSGADYAERSFEDMGGFDLYAPGEYGHEQRDLSATWPFYCIDWDRAWRELEMGDGYYFADGGYVFRP